MFRLRTFWLTCLTLAAAVTLSGCGATRLSVRVGGGQEAKYHTTMNTAFHGKDAGNGPLSIGHLLNGSSAAEFDTTIRFDSVSQSEADVTYALSNFKTQVAGLELPSALTPQDMTVGVKINPTTGQVLETKFPREISTGLPVLSTEQLSTFMFQSFPQLPKGGKARVGDSWTVTVPYLMPLPEVKPGPVLTITTKYETKETRAGTAVAKLSVAGSGPVEANGTLQGIGVGLTGTMELTGTHYVDLDTGLTYEMTSHMVFKYVQSMKEERTGLNINADMESVTDLTMVRR